MSFIKLYTSKQSISHEGVIDTIKELFRTTKDVNTKEDLNKAIERINQVYRISNSLRQNIAEAKYTIQKGGSPIVSGQLPISKIFKFNIDATPLNNDHEVSIGLTSSFKRHTEEGVNFAKFLDEYAKYLIDAFNQMGSTGEVIDVTSVEKLLPIFSKYCHLSQEATDTSSTKMLMSRHLLNDLVYFIPTEVQQGDDKLWFDSAKMTYRSLKDKHQLDVCQDGPAILSIIEKALPNIDKTIEIYFRIWGLEKVVRSKLKYDPYKHSNKDIAFEFSKIGHLGHDFEGMERWVAGLLDEVNRVVNWVKLSYGGFDG